ncbi:hypothetical protein DNTS_028625 [Danionella cerebrum]|uniref:CLIP1 zinc knuckle domain-containing protein n=1 Tax=Danionella cerebrum TaxID=2873325 RepID=A0A553MUB2_9TELE|nr:hypothetical protein DNTS_028625 [Danionella translucida]
MKDLCAIRYFQCQPKYGLFAPVHKVTRIGFPSTTPAKAKTTVRKMTTTPSGMKRSPSGSSISSMSSVASSASCKPSRAGLLTETSTRYSRKISGTTALQEALKEKQQHIEQLLAERDLERAEVAKATNHVGEVEQELTMLREGQEQYVVEANEKMDQLRGLVEAADREKVELLNQLEEEKRRVEDLQFRVEEACITKGDLEVATVSEKSRILELERDLSLRDNELAGLHKTLQALSGKDGVSDSAAAALQEEVCSLRSQLALQSNRYKADLSSLREKLEAQENVHSEALLQFQTSSNVLSKEKEQLADEIVVLKKENKSIVEQWHAKLESTQASHLNELKASDEAGRNELVQLQETLQHLNATHKQELEELQKKHESEALGWTGEAREHETQLQRINEENERQLEVMRTSLEKAEEQHLVELEEALGKLHAAELRVKELEDSGTKMNLRLLEKELEFTEQSAALQNLQSQQSQGNQEMQRLLSQVEEARSRIRSQEEKAIEIKSELEAKEQELHSLLQEKSSLEQEVGRLTNEELQAELRNKVEECMAQSAELQEMKSQLAGLQRNLKAGEERCVLLTKDKAKLEEDIMDMTRSSGDSSTLISKLNEEIKRKEGTLEELQGQLAEERERTAQAEEKLSKAQTQAEEDARGLSDKHRAEISSLQENIKLLKADLERTAKEQAKSVQTNQELQAELRNKVEECTAQSAELQEMKSQLAGLQRNLKAGEERCVLLTKDKAKLEEDIMDMTRSSGDSSTLISKLNEEIKRKEGTLEELQGQLAEERERTAQAEEKLSKAQTQAEEDARGLSDKHRAEISSLQENIKLLWKYHTPKHNEAAVTNMDLVKVLVESVTAAVARGQRDDVATWQTFMVFMRKLLKCRKSVLMVLQEESFEAKTKDGEKALGDAVEVHSKEKHQLIRNHERVEEELGAAQIRILELSKQTEELMIFKENAQEKQQLQNDTSEAEARLKNSVEELQKALDAVRLQNSEHLKTLKSDTERISKLTEEMIGTLVEDLWVFCVFSEELKQAALEKAQAMGDLRNQKEKLLEELANSHKDSNLLLNLKEECDALNEQLKEMKIRQSTLRSDSEKEKAELQQSLNTTSAAVSEKDEQLISLRNELDAVRLQNSEHLETLKSATERIRKLTEEITELKRAAVEKAQVLDALKTEKEKLTTDLANSLKDSNVLLNLKKECDNLNDQLKEMRMRESTLSNQSEKEKAALEQSLHSQKRDSLNGQLKRVEMRESTLSKEKAQEKAALQQSVQTQHALISEKDKEIESLRNEISALLDQIKGLEVLLKSQKSDNNQLQERLTVLETSKEGDDADDSAVRLWKEAKEDAECQVEFLNTVIVDLQRKNDELKTKLEKMAEAALNGNGAAELDARNSHEEPAVKKKPPPRLFCDICDCFDLHETEDCPTQDQMQDSPTHTTYHGCPSDERPYCDICEVFGHWTESCNDDQTF